MRLRSELLFTILLGGIGLIAAGPAGADSEIPVPSFTDHPAGEAFTGKSAPVDLSSHPAAREMRTRLREGAVGPPNFAGHYRVIVIGCGAGCQSVWIVDLVDGSVSLPFGTGSGVAHQADSRLIIANDPEVVAEFLGDASPDEVESRLAMYGAPEYWVERDGAFERIPPFRVRFDPATGRFIGMPGDPLPPMER
jgi:hypothetical protein